MAFADTVRGAMKTLWVFLIGCALFSFAAFAGNVPDSTGDVTNANQINPDAGLPAAYSGAEITGRIVDKETGAPIEGAVVVASWQVYRVEMTRLKLSTVPNTNKLFYIVEALTDSQGHYVVPAWGPIERTGEWRISPYFGPVLAIFKPGYDPEYRNNMAWQKGSETGPPYNAPAASVLGFVDNRKEIGLCRYGHCKDESLAEEVYMIKTSAPDVQSMLKIFKFAMHLQDNVRISDERIFEGTMPPDMFQQHLNTFLKQQNAIRMVDEEALRLTKRLFQWDDRIRFVKNHLRNESIKAGARK